MQQHMMRELVTTATCWHKTRGEKSHTSSMPLCCSMLYYPEQTSIPLSGITVGCSMQQMMRELVTTATCRGETRGRRDIQPLLYHPEGGRKEEGTKDWGEARGSDTWPPSAAHVILGASMHPPAGGGRREIHLARHWCGKARGEEERDMKLGLEGEP